VRNKSSNLTFNLLIYFDLFLGTVLPLMYGRTEIQREKKDEVNGIKNRNIYSKFTEKCRGIKLRQPPINLLHFEQGEKYFYITERKSDNLP
jgi:hypothetical protein